ncbi:hypothetical protein BCh11DRAFT_06429 [Burkholderia sp. Ch1-1]|nr:hypothetical protein BCh11DRAFT_06429 [Burkholderia sp. Ch1-1]
MTDHTSTIGLTRAQAIAAIDDFEIVGENNASRDPTDEERFVLGEFVARLFEDVTPSPADKNAEMLRSHGLSYYAPDGTFMNADGTRSIFDDVDQ